MPPHVGPSRLVNANPPRSRRPPGSRTSSTPARKSNLHGRGRPQKACRGRENGSHYGSHAPKSRRSTARFPQAKTQAETQAGRALVAPTLSGQSNGIWSTAVWTVFWDGYASGATQSDRFLRTFGGGVRSGHLVQCTPLDSLMPHEHTRLPVTVEECLRFRYPVCEGLGCVKTVRAAVTIVQPLFVGDVVSTLPVIRRKFGMLLRLRDKQQTWYTQFWLQILQYHLIEYIICRFCLAQYQGAIAKRMQVEAIWQLAFNQGDAILVAPCGYGKSVVFHTFTILTGLTTIMVVPLSVIGNQQQDIVNAVADTHGGRSLSVATNGRLQAKFLDAAAINAALVSGEPITTRIRDGTYNFLITSPEVLLDNVLGAILREYGIPKLGLVAIDELHLVRHWDSFRKSFARLGVVRGWVGNHVPLFGCSGTLSDGDRVMIQSRCAFQPVGRLARQTQIFRELIDRPNLSLRLCPMPPTGQNQFDALAFLCSDVPASQDLSSHGAASSQHLPRTHLEIPVTLVYIDNSDRLLTAQDCIRLHLVSNGFTVDQSTTMVQVFWSGTDPMDKEILERDLAREQPGTRIVLCTMALSMGLDCPCVRRVVQFGSWPKACVASLWQRFCRAARRHGMSACVYIFLPRAIFELVYARQGNGSKAVPWGQCICAPLIPDTYCCSCARDEHSNRPSKFSYGCAGSTAEQRLVLTSRPGVSKFPLHLVELVAAPCLRRFLLAYLSESEANLLSLSIGGECCNGRHCMTSDEIDASIPVLPPRRSTRATIGAHSKRILEVVLRPFLSRYSETLAHANGLVAPIGPGSLLADFDMVLADSLRTFIVSPEPSAIAIIVARLASVIPQSSLPLLWTLDPGLARLGSGIFDLWERLWAVIQPSQAIQGPRPAGLQPTGLRSAESQSAESQSVESQSVESQSAESHTVGGISKLEDQALGMEGLYAFDFEFQVGSSQKSRLHQAGLMNELEPPASARFHAPHQTGPVAKSSALKPCRQAISPGESRVRLRASPKQAQCLPSVEEALGEDAEAGRSAGATNIEHELDVDTRVYSVGVGLDGETRRKRRRPAHMDVYEVNYSSSPTKSPRRSFR